MDVYKDVHNLSYHYAELYRRNKLLASSRNSVGSQARGSGWTKFSLHAEIAVIKKLGDLSKLKGSILIVVRKSKTNETMISKPCAHCQKLLSKFMKQNGLLSVYYSTGIQ